MSVSGKRKQTERTGCIVVTDVIHVERRRLLPCTNHHEIPPATVLTVFLAVSPLFKGVEAGANKRTRLEYSGVRLGEGV